MLMCCIAHRLQAHVCNCCEVFLIRIILEMFLKMLFLCIAWVLPLFCWCDFVECCLTTAYGSGQLVSAHFLSTVTSIVFYASSQVMSSTECKFINGADNEEKCRSQCQCRLCASNARFLIEFLIHFNLVLEPLSSTLAM